MRIDTIGQILTYGNVAAFRNVMVVESCKGLILSAIAERVGGIPNNTKLFFKVLL